jgi:hypothetical protein
METIIDLLKWWRTSVKFLAWVGGIVAAGVTLWTQIKEYFHL